MPRGSRRGEAKKKARITVEQSKEVDRIFQAARRTTGWDLEAVEMALNEAVLAAGAKCLEEFMNGVGHVGGGSRPDYALSGIDQRRGNVLSWLLAHRAFTPSGLIKEGKNRV